MSDCVLFRELESVSDKKIGVATLNSEKSLNALSLDMVELLTPQLTEWQQRDDIALVMLEGAGEKAFCAGGDVVQLFNAGVSAGHGNYSADIENFFTKEYQLDYLIHTYNKPILLWGHGIVMGGGLGLLAGASHRVVTEKSRIAMPEITIGLYPDVGGTYFLNQMPEGCGLFLGLTGASINAADAKYVNLADHFVLNERKGELLEKLLVTTWGNTAALNHQKLTDALIEFETTDQIQMPTGNVSQYKNFMTELAQKATASSAVAAILDYATEDKWLSKAKQSLSHGSALTAHIVFQQLQVGKELSLAECFQFELGLSCNCSAIGEFTEGVRALLIEKDNQPKWIYETVHDVQQEMVDRMFAQPWTEEAHPLRELGR